MRQHLGLRVLVTLGDNDAVRQCVVELISPNSKYVRLMGDRVDDEPIGWVPVADVKICAVIGMAYESMSATFQKCYEKAGGV